MNKLSKKYLQRFSLLLVCLLLPWTIILCCGPSLSSDEQRFSLFNSGLEAPAGLKPFTYSQQLYQWEPEKQPDYIRNCNEWVSYSSNKAKEADVYNVQYETPPDIFVQAYKRNNWKSFGNNSFIKWLIQKENAAALQYMVLAKQAEAVDFAQPDPWDTTVERQKKEVAKLAQLSFQKIATAPAYLQPRYAFQAMKLWAYIGREGFGFAPQMRQAYERHLQGKPTIVAAWANIYYAMVLQDRNEQTRYLLKAFDESEEKKQYAFLHVEKDDLVQLQQVTKDPKMLALVHAMQAYKTNGRALKHLQALARYDAVEKYLPMLVGQEVNKLETWLWTPAMLGFEYEERAMEEYTQAELDRLRRTDVQYLGQLRAFVEGLQMRRRKPSLQLALVHLYNMERQYNKAKQLLQTLPVYMNKQLEVQRLVEQVVVTAHTTDITSPQAKALLAAQLKKLYQLNESYRKRTTKDYTSYDDEGAERTDDWAELVLMLSRGYEKKKDTLTAGMLYTKAGVITNAYDGWSEGDVGYGHIAWYDRFASPHHIDSLLALKHKKDKTGFEKLLSPVRWAKDDMYRDVKLTILFRQKRYAEALAVAKQMNPSFWEDNYEYADFLPLTHITNTGFAPQTKSRNAYKMVSKRLVLEDVVKITNTINNATNDEAKAAAYYQLGNVQVNTSYNGKGWMMFSYGKSANEDYAESIYPQAHWFGYTFWPNGHRYGDDYYRCRSAMDNFRRAMSLTKNNELKAKCLLGLVACSRFQENSSTTYLRQLKQYRNTASVREAAIDCPDVREWVR
ncbi:hypothetical protein [Aridibaculum aurantiacum]|uniref:hypothetical protein n=1 Tax=Aridibaculum aurantiacum TaxID=2810307 RepID=UPI001A956DDA|nr:hypothetical protein [Aridibaculum aurantiacum]